MLLTNIFEAQNNTVAVICGLTPVVCSMMQNRRNRCKEKVKKDEIKPEIVCKVKGIVPVSKTVEINDVQSQTVRENVFFDTRGRCSRSQERDIIETRV